MPSSRRHPRAPRQSSVPYCRPASSRPSLASSASPLFAQLGWSPRPLLSSIHSPPSLNLVSPSSSLSTTLDPCSDRHQKLQRVFRDAYSRLEANLSSVIAGSDLRSHAAATLERQGTRPGASSETADMPGGPCPPLPEQNSAIDGLREWFLQHLGDPYPNISEKAQLAKCLGLKPRTIDSHLTNWRRRSGWANIKDLWGGGTRAGMRILIERYQQGFEARLEARRGIQQMSAYFDSSQQMGDWLAQVRRFAPASHSNRKRRWWAIMFLRLAQPQMKRRRVCRD